jgi:CRISPR system Cascade subunit CasD
MGVRVDREGLLMRDYQTATGLLLASGKPDHKRTAISPRFYLADAAFLVGLEGSRTLLDTLQSALKQPVWPLSLGRKSMPPGKPVWLADGVRDTDLLTTLEQADYLTEPLQPHDIQPLRLMLEHPTEGAVRLDQPVAPFAQRRFGPRFVQSATLERRHAPDSTHA